MSRISNRIKSNPHRKRRLSKQEKLERRAEKQKDRAAKTAAKAVIVGGRAERLQRESSFLHDSPQSIIPRVGDYLRPPLAEAYASNSCRRVPNEPADLLPKSGQRAGAVILPWGDEQLNRELVALQRDLDRRPPYSIADTLSIRYRADNILARAAQRGVMHEAEDCIGYREGGTLFLRAVVEGSQRVLARMAYPKT